MSDFHDNLGLHCNRIAVVAELQLFKPGGHGCKFLIREALEGFAYGSEPARPVGHGQMIVGEPAASSSRTAIGGYDHAIDGFGRFYLEPELASVAGHVGAI